MSKIQEIRNYCVYLNNDTKQYQLLLDRELEQLRSQNWRVLSMSTSCYHRNDLQQVGQYINITLLVEQL
ncbi:hypothetical protein [Dysgonomonas termitidis]|uniref:Uncharacterized protein n=1 Tax=Dysgonomonas termitidis TaxID=1516126 RepID=A0ABV9L186_9BACT